MDRTNKNIALIIPIIFLALALLGGWPYGFFTVLRLVVFVCSLFVAWISYETKQTFWIWSFALIALLFNPFIPIYLDRDTWIIIDILVGIFMAVAIFKLKNK